MAVNCVSHFLVAELKYHDQKQPREENDLFSLIVVEEMQPMVEEKAKQQEHEANLPGRKQRNYASPAHKEQRMVVGVR